ncbi:hypothetical protein [Brevibacillus borstelensis]|uniref:hypothetical protein n=1 Tax=Brevibacillus borstelensis TaxID=45462 RepID=UPI0030BD8D53
MFTENMVLSDYWRNEKGDRTKMEFIGFFLFSILEYVAIFSLMFSLYRLQSRFYWIEQLIISAILSFISYSLRELFHTEVFTPVVLIALMSILLWIVLRIPFFYIALMTVPTYIVYALIQYGVMEVLDHFQIIMYSQAFENNGANWYGQVIQGVTAAVTFIISWVISKFGIGFSFIPSGYVKIKLTGLNLIIAIALTVGFLAFIFFNYWIKSRAQFAALSSLYIIVLGVLIYLSRKKDYE